MGLGRLAEVTNHPIPRRIEMEEAIFAAHDALSHRDAPRLLRLLQCVLPLQLLSKVSCTVFGMATSNVFARGKCLHDDHVQDPDLLRLSKVKDPVGKAGTGRARSKPRKAKSGSGHARVLPFRTTWVVFHESPHSAEFGAC